MVSRVDPQQWLVSTFRALKSYLEENLDTDVYEIVGSFAEADDLAQKIPFEKTIIHFEIDDIGSQPLGFGDGKLDEIDNGDGTITEKLYEFHTINFDIGIWASSFDGGVTARMLAWQRLRDLLAGHASIVAVREATDIEIRHFNGGRFEVERVNDQKVFRVINSELQVRVAGMKERGAATVVDDIDQDPNLTISGITIDQDLV
jgi:hypothetical protein